MYSTPSPPIWDCVSGNEKSFSGFYLPWRYVVISVLCVFAVVYATMLYAQAKGKKEDIAEVLKNSD